LHGGCHWSRRGVVQARGIVGAQKGGAAAPNAIGNFPTAAGQARAARRGMKSFLAGATGGQSVQSGGGYGFTTQGAVLHQNAAPAVTEMSDCNRLAPAFKMGAGQIYRGAAVLQKGGSRNPLAPTASDYFNQSTQVGYGYKSGADNLLFAGSGYPKETATTSINTCQSGGGRRKRKRKKKRGGKRSRKHARKHHVTFPFSSRTYKHARKHRKHRKHPKKRQPSRTRKGRLDFVTHKGDKAYNRSGHRQYRRRRPYTKKRGRRGGFLCGLKRHYTHPKKGQASRTRKGHLDFITHLGDRDFNTRGHRQRRRRKPYTKKKGGRKHRRRRQRGGSRYLQYQSNVPLTRTMQTPNGSQGGSWAGQLATPPTYKVLNNCQDDYNHYAQQ